MNILYILGNGFDKAQGMSTSYPEFYQHLKDNVKNGSPLLEKMKSAISENIELWSDMEIGLGKFTSTSKDVEEFGNFYFELSEYLQDYLKNEENNFTPTRALKTKFQEDLVQHGKYFGESDKERYAKYFKNNNLFSQDMYDVITLNYTNTLEKILEMNGTSSKLIGYNKVLRNIYHVHGILGNSVIIGVDNEEQITNTTFRTNDDVKDLLIKMQSNQIMKETRHRQCENLIAEANVIILFGVSLGDTDLKWWKLIGDNFLKRKNLAIIQHLYKPGAIKQTRRQMIGRIERLQQRYILQKMRIEEEHWSEYLYNRLFFTINEPVFQI